MKNMEQANKGGNDRQRATIWFWSVVGLYAVTWILVPSLLHTAYRGDVIEIQSAAPEWVWSTTKHPMLPAWILETLNILTCRSFAAPFIATQLCTVLTLWSVWRLSRTVLDERLALIAAFSTLLYAFFAIKPVWYNQNNVLIALWSLSVYLVFQALQTNYKRYWISSGIALGLAFHAKYSAVFLVISILAYMFVRKECRKCFQTPGPYITTIIAFAVFLPHIVWLFYHHFVTLTYIAERPDMSPWLAPFYFAGGQLLYLLLIMAIVIPVIGVVWRVRHHEQDKAMECEKFLFYCFMVPFVCHLLISIGMGVVLQMEYGAPFWCFSGLWLILRFRQIQETLQCFRQAVTLTIAILFFIAVGFVSQFWLGQQHPNLYQPTRELGITCEQIWHARFPGINCPYIVASDDRLSGHAAYAMTVRPSVIIPQATWANDDDLNQKGGLLVWEKNVVGDDMPEYLRYRFPKAEILPESSELSYKVGSKVQMQRLGFAIVARPGD